MRFTNIKRETAGSDVLRSESGSDSVWVLGNLAQRIIVAIVAIPLILWLCYLGGWPLNIFLGLLTFLGFRELAVCLSDGRQSVIGAVGSFMALAVAASSLIWGVSIALGVYFAVFLVASSLYIFHTRQPRVMFGDTLILVWGVFYVGLLYPFVAHIRSAPLGDTFGWILLLWGTLWLGDTAAMWGGKVFGKNRLAPIASPNKTIEGAIAGLGMALVVGALFPVVGLLEAPLWASICAALIISIFGQVGDLVESLWKRSMDIKNSSAVIPGHGGVLDRFDSLAFAAPALFYFLMLVN